MDRDLASPADRVRWAVEHSRLNLAVIAERIGCSHSALSYWQTGKTNLVNVKVGLLLEFCKATGANMHWLLTGDGPRLSWQRPTTEPPLMTAARHIVQDTTAELAETAYRLLLALDPPPLSPPAAPKP